MASTTKRYPLSSPNGQPIPLDVVKPLGFLKKSFSAVVSGDISIPPECELISITTTENCYIAFGGIAAVPADGVYVGSLLYAKKGLRMTVAPPADVFTVIRDTADGELQVQFLDKWASVTLATQNAKK